MPVTSKVHGSVWSAIAAVLIAGGFSFGAAAADPSNVQFVVDTGPGGGSDLFAREIVKIAQQNKIISGNWPVISQSQGGGLGAMAFMKLKAGHDNYIAAFTSKWVVSSLNAPGARAKLQDLTPIIQLLDELQVVAVPASSPYKTFAEFIADAQKNPGKYVQVGGAVTSVDYLAALVIEQNTHSSWKYLSFPDGGPRITALLRGDAQIMIGAVTDFSEQVAANKLKIIGVLSDKRVPAFPDAPTLKEQGIPDQGIPAQLQFRGIAGPPNMSPEAVAYFQKVFTDVTKTDDWKQYMEREGDTTEVALTDEVKSRIADFTEKLGPAVKLLKAASQ